MSLGKSAAGKIAYQTRLANGSEARRLAAVRDAHETGRYENRNKALSKRMKLVSGSLQPAAIAARERLAYAWLMGKNNWVARLSAAEKKKWHSGLMKLNSSGGKNGFESKLEAFLRSHLLPFVYSGDRRFWVVGKRSSLARNPDFIYCDPKRRLAILAHGRYWHRSKNVVKREMLDYKKCGWKCFIVWDSDSLNRDLAIRINKFVESSV